MTTLEQAKWWTEEIMLTSVLNPTTEDFSAVAAPSLHKLRRHKMSD